MKGPPGKMKRDRAQHGATRFSAAPAGPQFDKEGYVYVLAHEDDVRITRWREKYDQIPAGTKDPGLLKAQEGPGAEAARSAARFGAILERGAIPEAGGRARRASCTAAARCPGGCWPTCSTPRPRSI